MADNEHKYPADEFDAPQIGPIGLHRGKRSFIIRALPYIITLVVALALATLAWAFFSGAFNNRATEDVAAGTSAVATDEASAESTDPASGAASADSTDSASGAASASEAQTDSTDTASATESASSSATANLSASVAVYNASGVNGAAAKSAQTLQSGGYTDVSAMNPSNSSNLPAQTTVWYRTDADLATAQDIANKLGITQVVQASNISYDVAVVLI